MGNSVKTSPRGAGGVLSRLYGLRTGVCLLMILCVFAAQGVFPTLSAASLLGGFTLKDEEEYGKKFNVLVRSRMPLVQDPEVVKYVESVINRLEKTLPPHPFPFTVSVVRHNAINAFAAPGGYIFVYTGLILSMRHEAEMAGVLAHEMAHVTQRHIAGRIESMQLVGALSILGALAGAFLGGQAGPAAMAGSMAAGQAAMLSYSRADEAEADQVGMGYLTKARYNPQGMVGAFEIISRKQWLMGSEIPSYLSTHPGANERVKDMSLRVSRLPAAQRAQKDEDSQFLRIQALVRARYADPEPAARTFEQQLKDPATRCIALMGQGILASRQNRIADATAAFDQALACSPKDELIVREAGRFHYTKGNRTRGMDLLAQAVRMDRNDTMALFYYARSLDDAGNTTQAIEYTQAVLRQVPEDSEVHEILARLYGKSRDMFRANLHMAYSGLYENKEPKVEQFLGKAKSLAQTPQQRDQLDRFETLYKERKGYW